MSVVDGVKRDLAELPKDLRESGLAEGALAIARVMDDFETSPAEMASCLRALHAALNRLRELAPPKEAKDGVDQIAERRAKRRARGAATKG
jgi:hypothetical protein